MGRCRMRTVSLATFIRRSFVLHLYTACHTLKLVRLQRCPDWFVQSWAHEATFNGDPPRVIKLQHDAANEWGERKRRRNFRRTGGTL